MLSIRIGLISHSALLGWQQMAAVAQALTIQLNRDAGPIWGVSGSVVALQDDKHLDPGTWPIYIEDDLDEGVAGNHATDHQQPLAVIEAGDSWSLTASHEMLEMATDPYGNRLAPAAAIGIVDGQVEDVPGKVEYLVEVCDPMEDPAHSYLIDDVLVADFYAPAYFDPAGTGGARYSFTGSITRPRQVLPGGYITWYEAATRKMRQLRYLDPANAVIVDVFGGAPVTAALLGGRSLRSSIDRLTPRTHNLSRLPADHPAMVRRAACRAKLDGARGERARLFHEALAGAKRRR